MRKVTSFTFLFLLSLLESISFCLSWHQRLSERGKRHLYVVRKQLFLTLFTFFCVLFFCFFPVKSVKTTWKEDIFLEISTILSLNKKNDSTCYHISMEQKLIISKKSFVAHLMTLNVYLEERQFGQWNVSLFFIQFYDGIFLSFFDISQYPKDKLIKYYLLWGSRCNVRRFIGSLILATYQKKKES